MNRFEGKIIALSGAAGGIGTQVSQRLIGEGGILVAVDRNDEALERLQRSLNAPDQLAARTIDVSDESQCEALADWVRQRYGRIDILINNAGYFPARPFEDVSYAEWRHVTAVNLDSVFLMTKSLLPLMKGNGWGRIVNIGSSSVFNAPPFHAHYVAAKSGVIGLSRCLANDLGRFGITVNVVSPGLTDTPAVRAELGLEMLQVRVGLRAIARVQVAQDVVGAITFLASDDAAFITGQLINVDGGARFY